MGLQVRNLSFPFLLICFLWLPDLKTVQSTTVGSSSLNTVVARRALDTLLQDYAYRAFVNPKTGIPYDGVVPSNLTGIKVAAMRLRRGSLYRKGFTMYKEFQIPMGVVESPYVERLAFVYQNLGNWSMTYYPLQGYTYLTPVLGLLAYDASNLSAKNLPELDVWVSSDPISIKFPDVKSGPSGAKQKCVSFDLKGLVNFSNVELDNVCSTMQQGHFSIVVESIAPSPAPTSPSPKSSGAPNAGATPSAEEGKKKKNSKAWIVVGSVLGGLALLVVLAFLLLWAQKYQHKKKRQRMERAADAGEAFHMTSAGNTKAPSATVTRTQPVLESEYVP